MLADLTSAVRSGLGAGADRFSVTLLPATVCGVQMGVVWDLSTRVLYGVIERGEGIHFATDRWQEVATQLSGHFRTAIVSTSESSAQWPADAGMYFQAQGFTIQGRCPTSVY